ncbi:MAG: hypothetical protein AAF558_14705, partial [Verrucomicrobiota bacterium]
TAAICYVSIYIYRSGMCREIGIPLSLMPNTAPHDLALAGGVKLLGVLLYSACILIAYNALELWTRKIRSQSAKWRLFRRRISSRYNESRQIYEPLIILSLFSLLLFFLVSTKYEATDSLRKVDQITTNQPRFETSPEDLYFVSKKEGIFVFYTVKDDKVHLLPQSEILHVAIDKPKRDQDDPALEEEVKIVSETEVIIELEAVKDEQPEP